MAAIYIDMLDAVSNSEAVDLEQSLAWCKSAVHEEALKVYPQKDHMTFAKLHLNLSLSLERGFRDVREDMDEHMALALLDNDWLPLDHEGD